MDSSFVPFSLSSTGILLTVCILGLAGVIYLRYFYVDFARIGGIPEIENASLLSGHLYRLGIDHASTLERWAQTTGWDVFQIRMGNRRAIVLNTFEAAQEWIITHQTATIDRPWFHTFHGVVSSTSAATIGTSPWNDRTKKQRRVVGSFTNAPAIQRLRGLLDLETGHMVSGLSKDGNNGASEIQPHIYHKRLALNIILSFCYGTRFANIDDRLLLEILSDAGTIASFRSTNSNFQDFIPHLRYLGGSNRTSKAIEVRNRRDKWLATMLDTVRSSVVNGKAKRCVAQGLLTENEQEGLTQSDVKTILGGLMSGGFETVFSTLIIGTGVLASHAGQIIQEKAYTDIMKHYSTTEEAFEQCLTEEKSKYIVAFAREVLRFYPPLKLLPARQTYKEFRSQDSVIPKNVLVYINAQAISRDKNAYGQDADVFRPERWLEDEKSAPPPYHFAFGAGSRMCTAVNLSNRILYASFARLILSFRITEGQTMPPNIDYVGYSRDTTASTAIPKDFKAIFMPRDTFVLEKNLERATEA